MRDPDRYAAILRIRQQAEDREAQAMTAIRGRIQQTERQRTALELARQTTLDQAGATLRKHFDAGDIRGYYQYERHIAHLRDQKDADIRELQQQEAKQRAVLETATRERRIAEKLHGRRWEHYRAYLVREEQKQMDETATMYAARDSRLQRHPAERGKKSKWSK